MGTRGRLLIICLIATVAVPVWGAQYWVAQHDPGASDDNPGTASQPWKTLAKAAAMLESGDMLTIDEGVYRESLVLATAGRADAPITIQAARLESGGYEPVVITGADVITDWQSLEEGHAVWVHKPWTHIWLGWREDMSHGAAPPIGRCEQVVLDGSDSTAGQLLKPVLSLDEMEPGTFFADPKQSQSLFVRLPDDSDPREHRIEASVRSVLVKAGAHTHLRGLTIRHAANAAQKGALQVEGSRFLLEDCSVEWTNGTGIRVAGSDYIVRRCVSQYNGQLGLGGGGTNLLIEECVFAHNNVKGFSAGWEAGGFKIVNSRGAKVLRSQAIHNKGTGIWFDIDNYSGQVRQCYCADNTRSGIFIEISGDFVVADNLCVGNGGREEGDWAGAGICIGESDDCYVAFNSCVRNQYGISIRGQVPRTAGSKQSHPYYSKGITIRNNLLAYNTIAQFGLCWDNVFFGRHPDEKNLTTPQWRAKVANLMVDPGRIQLLLDHNFYAASENQELVRWGVSWRPKWKAYTDLATLYAEQGCERTGQVGDPQFVDLSGHDLRLQEHSPATEANAGIRYPVPGHPAIIAPSAQPQ